MKQKKVAKSGAIASTRQCHKEKEERGTLQK
jgi:hypothetical protein